jgi:hypothetical protein
MVQVAYGPPGFRLVSQLAAELDRFEFQDEFQTDSKPAGLPLFASPPPPLR